MIIIVIIIIIIIIISICKRLGINFEFLLEPFINLRYQSLLVIV